jgi:hypothetical protein
MDVLTKVQIAPQSRANPKFDKGGQVDWKRGPIEMEAKEREVLRLDRECSGARLPRHADG